jgi:hypothetical protein
MPRLFQKRSGTWVEIKSIFQKQGGTWTEILNIFQMYFLFVVIHQGRYMFARYTKITLEKS